MKRYKGCCYLCSKFIRGQGKACRLRFSDLRKLGVKRRLSKSQLKVDS